MLSNKRDRSVGVNMRATLTASFSDEDLVAQFQQTRADSAFEELVRRHLPRVRSMVLQMVLDDSAADDLTQDTMLSAVRGLDSFRGQSRFATWLYRIAMNTTYNYLKRRSRSPVSFHRELPDNPDAAAPPDVQAMKVELLDEVQTAIGDLSPKLRAGIVLTCLQGMSNREAAEVEGCSEATMYWRIHQARKQLKRTLQRHLS